MLLHTVSVSFYKKTLEQKQMNLMSLEDKFAIHEVIARYSYTWDAKDPDGFVLLFTEDGVMGKLLR